jgi:hypothetical protein
MSLSVVTKADDKILHLWSSQDAVNPWALYNIIPDVDACFYQLSKSFIIR